MKWTSVWSCVCSSGSFHCLLIPRQKGWKSKPQERRRKSRGKGRKRPAREKRRTGHVHAEHRVVIQWIMSISSHSAVPTIFSQPVTTPYRWGYAIKTRMMSSSPSGSNTLIRKAGIRIPSHTKWAVTRYATSILLEQHGVRQRTWVSWPCTDRSCDSVTPHLRSIHGGCGGDSVFGWNYCKKIKDERLKMKD